MSANSVGLNIREDVMSFSAKGGAVLRSLALGMFASIGVIAHAGGCEISSVKLNNEEISRVFDNVSFDARWLSGNSDMLQNWSFQSSLEGAQSVGGYLKEFDSDQFGVGAYIGVFYANNDQLCIRTEYEIENTWVYDLPYPNSPRNTGCADVYYGDSSCSNEYFAKFNSESGNSNTARLIPTGKARTIKITDWRVRTFGGGFRDYPTPTRGEALTEEDIITGVGVAIVLWALLDRADGSGVGAGRSSESNMGSQATACASEAASRILYCSEDVEYMTYGPKYTFDCNSRSISENKACRGFFRYEDTTPYAGDNYYCDPKTESKGRTVAEVISQICR